MKRKVFTIRRTLIALVIVLIALWCSFSSMSVCSVCGATQSETQWQLPFIDLTYWRTKSISETPLSKLANGTGLCPSHAHQWIFVQGGGNGVSCAIGQGRHIASAAVNQQWAEILSAVTTYREKETAARWLKISLDPERSRRFIGLLLYLPNGGLGDRETFEKWWKESVTETEKTEPEFFAAPH